MTNASRDQYDFIVVGAGAAGSVLASELSASGAKGAAARLGMKRSTLYNYMHRLGISRLKNSWSAYDNRPNIHL